ncbi:hypothetical protein LEMA_P009130.1 [Plenodomus lingam JN3]|uniref:BTB domain-containing protein n=1 Tax=Leptosphaeria maculans (strain JN3 / isolate v23.1.3 / race Av1-4-5-6-7-8) TaxID=985895 RepID=E5ACC4_LEPMJ|nr:hypothetical protein LEMA_P009130.1 [Plenodomus lingam JN3]CBY02126.1 hypothetical protein LEMA_P009130.1 [Plenodomus lingam JN3]
MARWFFDIILKLVPVGILPKTAFTLTVTSTNIAEIEVKASVPEYFNIKMAETSRRTLLENIKQCLGDSEFSDFSIICGTDVYPVHKVILCARSSVFQKAIMFPGKESSEHKIDLSEDEPELVKRMIQYFYEAEYSPLLPPPPNQTIHIQRAPHNCGAIGTGCRSIEKLRRVCDHHYCGPVCDFTCHAYCCDKCMDIDPNPAYLLTYSKMYQMADMYGIHGLKPLSVEKFSRACYKFWDHSAFVDAAVHVFESTPDHDRGLRDIVKRTISDHMGLLRKPEVEGFMGMFEGLAFEILFEKSKMHGWPNKIILDECKKYRAFKWNGRVGIAGHDHSQATQVAEGLTSKSCLVQLSFFLLWPIWGMIASLFEIAMVFGDHSGLEVVPQSEHDDARKYPVMPGRCSGAETDIKGMRIKKEDVGVAIIVVVGAGGGGVGGALASRSSNITSSIPSTDPQSPFKSPSASDDAIPSLSATSSPTTSTASVSTTLVAGPTSTLLRDCPSSNNSINSVTAGDSVMKFRKVCELSYLNANGVAYHSGTK